MDELKKDVLLGVQDGISETITIGNFEVYMTWSERFGNEYEIVKWKSEPYTPQCNKKRQIMTRNFVEWLKLRIVTR